MPLWETKKVLITVRTYPSPAQKGVEVSCTAGITEDREWIRLFPVPYRLMSYEQRFKKYQWIQLNVTKASDHRAESYKPDLDSIQIVGEVPPGKNKWAERKEIIYPLRAHCLCCLKEARKKDKVPTLGIFRPKVIHRLLIEDDEPEWTTDQVAKLKQQNMFDVTPAQELEKVPYRFKYEFECDHDGCPGHTLSCTDWEIYQSYRQWTERYGDDWEEKFRQKFETDMIEKNETNFYVGTMHGYPGTWIIVGLFYPRL